MRPGMARRPAKRERTRTLRQGRPSPYRTRGRTIIAGRRAMHIDARQSAMAAMSGGFGHAPAALADAMRPDYQ
jgi:hypothetical protein